MAKLKQSKVGPIFLHCLIYILSSTAARQDAHLTSALMASLCPPLAAFRSQSLMSFQQVLDLCSFHSPTAHCVPAHFQRVQPAAHCRQKSRLSNDVLSSSKDGRVEEHSGQRVMPNGRSLKHQPDSCKRNHLLLVCQAYCQAGSPQNQSDRSSCSSVDPM